jgi:glycosyltransferase involved in cell wall biosynthesis
MKTVLIFAHECAPYERRESTVGAQRPAQFAKYLPEFGWRAIVLCCDVQARGSARRRDAASIAAEVRAVVGRADRPQSVVVPTPSLPAAGLLDRCWRATLPRNGHRRGARTLLRKPLTAAKFLTGDYSEAWQWCARVGAAAIAEDVVIDACIGEHSPDAGLFLARWFSRQFGVPWVADFRDPILQPLRPRARALYRPLAKRLVGTASATIAVNEAWADLDRALFGRPAYSVPNGFDPEEFPPPDAAKRNDVFTIAYLGNIIREQRLDEFLGGLGRLLRRADGPLPLRFVYRGFAHAAVAERAARYGVTALVDTAAWIERGSALDLLTRADMLLVLSIADPAQRDVYHARGLYPGKTFECFGARRPILCTTGDGAQLDRLIEATRTGVVLRTPEEIAEFLSRALDDWKAGRTVPYEPNTHVVQEYTRRSLTGRLAGVLDSVMQRSGVA